jgi:hypothetical protein
MESNQKLVTSDTVLLLWYSLMEKNMSLTDSLKKLHCLLQEVFLFATNKVNVEFKKTTIQVFQIMVVSKNVCNCESMYLS